MLARNVLLAIGVFALLAGVLLSVVWIQQSPQSGTQGRTPILPTQAILTAARPIPVGTLLRLEDMVWNEVPEVAIVGANIVRGRASETDFVGSVTRRAFHEREALVATAFVKPGDREFLVTALAPGTRAVSIGVDAAQGTSGLMLPGDRVDVILAQNFNVQGTDPRQKSVAETVLHDLRVIAVDQISNPVAKPAEPRLGGPASEFRVPKTITLEVTEQQGQKLLVADQLGKIQLALRGRQSSEPSSPTLAAVPPTWASDVSLALSKTEPAAVQKGQGAIEVMHGAKVERRCPTANGLVACQ
jgi:pilus assembly protein CpaB